MILGLAMSGDDLAGLVISCLIVGYLVYALIFPEKL